MKDVLALPFDQYQRYRLVADFVAELERRAARGTPLRVLDVGGRTALLRSFLPEADVVLVDLEPSAEPGLVLGDGSRLPFRDRSFDVVASFDTLEHVPPQARDAFVAECARVSRAHVFLAGPYGSPEVDEAERLLQAFLKQKLGIEHRYLEEHRRHGLPSREATEETLRALGATVASFGQGNLERWLVLMCMEMYMDHDPGLRPIAARFFRFYNRALHPSDHAEPVYRHTVVAALAGAALPAGEGLFGAAAAPRGALATVAELGYELVAFDREKDVWQPEFERLRGVVADVEKDLAGHRARLAEAEADLALHRDVKAALEREVAGYEAGVRALEEELATTREGAAAIQAELRGARAECEAMGRHIGHLEGLLTELRGQLRDRVGNLKRAFGRKPTF